MYFSLAMFQHGDTKPQQGSKCLHLLAMYTFKFENNRISNPLLKQAPPNVVLPSNFFPQMVQKDPKYNDLLRHNTAAFLENAVSVKMNKNAMFLNKRVRFSLFINVCMWDI